ncbi:hypothetical protein D6817_02815 [Candidatus Pacearchaeota archaeon]|nr:MAG: hypothetical protein D6817_02815 [Candidatus Pacearchaeota archaeon]
MSLDSVIEETTNGEKKIESGQTCKEREENAQYCYERTSHPSTRPGSSARWKRLALASAIFVSGFAIGRSCSYASHSKNEIVKPYFLYEQTEIVEIEKPGKYLIHATRDGIHAFPYEQTTSQASKSVEK